MTFYPPFGIRSTEDFNSRSGAIFSDQNLQDITNGIVTLVSSNTGSYSVFRHWLDVSHWSFENSLYSTSTITGSFLLKTGSAYSGHTVTQSGSQGISSPGTPWYSYTEDPIFSSTHNQYSGQISKALYLGESSPYSGYATGINLGSNTFTIQFDVSSILAYSGMTSLPGYSTGQSNLTGLPHLTGILGHGVLIQTLNKWDYIEITPYGLRSFNHPELAIAHNMLNPTRVRIGINNTDIYLATEDGKSIYGLNKFDTTHPQAPTNPMLMFGAPTLGVNGADYSPLTGADGFYGLNLWDNIKILTGQLAIHQNTLQRSFSTGTVSMWTAPFDPNIAIHKYLYAQVDYVPSRAGTTTIFTEYSGLTGWTVHNSTSLSTGFSTNIDLSNIPIYNYPRTDLGTDYCNNPIRFRIDQRSYSGYAIPPAVEAISVLADKERFELNIDSNWKPFNKTTIPTLTILTGKFATNDPVPDAYTSYLFNVPTSTGRLATGIAFYDETSNSLPVRTIGGTGEIFLGGPYRAFYKNYSLFAVNALTGSVAETVFGADSVDQLYPNPTFDSAFRTIQTGEARYYTGLTAGKLSEYVEIGTFYTGLFRIDFNQNQIFRTISSENSRSRIGYGQAPDPIIDYAQGAKIYPSTYTHQGNVGFEAFVPTGIASGNLLVTFDLQISQGSGVAIYISGGGTPKRTYTVFGDQARNYVPISLYATASYPSELRVGICAPSGYNGDWYEYNIDNFNVHPVSFSYLKTNFISGALHSTGITNSSLGLTTVPARRASTIFNTELFLEAYPSSNSGLLIKTVDQNNKGFEININGNGYLTAYVDQENYSWSTSSSAAPQYEGFATQSIQSNIPVPIGRWSTIGLMHDVNCMDNLGYVSYSGGATMTPATNFATNRLYLSIDGQIVASKDLMSGWKSHSSHVYGESAPYVSYIPMSGAVTATMVSGLICGVDGLYISRPPVADTEFELAIKGARTYAPYFVPDPLFKGNVPEDGFNALYATGNSEYTYSKDIFLGSIYNFSSPYYTNWDRGPIRNHLVIYGPVEVFNDSPYTGYSLTSTRYRTGSYAVAEYSSATERLMGTTGQLTLVNAYTGFNSGNTCVLGWVKPYTTGTFFSIYENKLYSTGNRYDLAIDTNQKFSLVKYNSSSNAVMYIHTGHDCTTGSWNYFALDLNQDSNQYHTTGGSTSKMTIKFTNYTGMQISSVYSGVDYGLKYQGGAVQSQFKFGGTCDVSMFNWAIFNPSSYSLYRTGSDGVSYVTESDKGGRHQTFLDGTTPYTGETDWRSYYQATVRLGPVNTPGLKFYSVAPHNSYDSSPRLAGPWLFDNVPFRNIPTYKLKYNLDRINRTFGATDSPIRIGQQVPDSAINIAKFSAPSYTVESSINTIDLSDKNINNLITYHRGNYYVSPTSVSPSILTGYNLINRSVYSGMADIVCSGQVVSSDVNISMLSVYNSDYTDGEEGYYYYLIGRGSRGIKVLGSYPHYTGQLTTSSTGTVTDNYIANIEKIKANIVFRDRNGTNVTDQIFYDIVTSPYTPSQFYDFVRSGNSLNLDNIGSQWTGHLLPDGVFSTILITNSNVFLDNQTLFVYYNSYDYNTQESIPGYKEIVNPQPIFRERYMYETPGIGKFDLALSTNNYYDLKIYGIYSGNSGQF